MKLDFKKSYLIKVALFVVTFTILTLISLLDGKSDDYTVATSDLIGRGERLVSLTIGNSSRFVLEGLGARVYIDILCWDNEGDAELVASSAKLVEVREGATSFNISVLVDVETALNILSHKDNSSFSVMVKSE